MSTPQGPRRIAQWLYLKPEAIDEYKKCHAAVWPEVLEQIKDSNIRDCKYSPRRLVFPSSHFPLAIALCLEITYSIFLTMSPRPTLFASFKYIGHAFDDDMARMAANPKVQEWWRMTDGMQESPVEGAQGSAKGPGWWGQMEEVFYVE
ncbi:hypothetical protein BM1_06832 [Bipolaris maydis]|nr:hypothetical protein BM1_06832 [Bipolaris maydis]